MIPAGNDECLICICTSAAVTSHVITMAAWRTITAGRIAALALAAAAMVATAAADNDDDEVDAERIEESDHILVLNSKNFDKATKEYQQLLVEWYSPSCGHCKALEPGK